MKTWRYYLQLFRFQPVMYTINLIGIVGGFLLEMVPGLLSREYFNLLSGAAPARFDLNGLIVLLIAGALGRMVFYMMLPMTNTTFVYTCGALLRKMDVAIQEAIQLPVKIADDPLTCVARGTFEFLSQLHLYSQVLPSGDDN